MKEQLRIFLTAVMFYTRIPCPHWVDHSPEYINKATRFFPLIGWIVGGISFLVFFGTRFIFPTELCVMLSMLAGILTTGAFHEDGLADVFDGFGGGWTKEKILEIMKDSRVGAYGAISLVFLFLIKFYVLYYFLRDYNIEWYFVLLIFVMYHSLARLAALGIVFTSEYAREDEDSKAKPIAKSHGIIEISGALFFGLLPLLILSFFFFKFIFILIPIILLVFLARRYFIKWLGGYTGDCLGATEQLAELVILVCLIARFEYGYIFH